MKKKKKTNRDVWKIEACANDKIFNRVNQDQIDIIDIDSYQLKMNKYSYILW